jgi:DNA (cytosine-5)-methyltransferase 1
VLQQNIFSEQSLTYASHITTFCTAVDIYRPLYGILENVVNMASTRTGLEDQNVLSQLVACLVSLGYQVNQYIVDSWTYGSCQQRSRIILTIAAPGLEPILQRPHTHSRSYEDTSARSLGKLPNGERFGDREHYATPFPYVTAEEATFDLPDIGNGNVQTCIPFPDHRLSRPTNSKARALIECIPTEPPGYGYREALELDLVPYSLRLAKKETGRSYRRIKAHDLVPTITTDVNMQDARNGASVHWSQHRPLSIQDAKRTQGYKDHEPIIGTLGEQWKILGNGVDRKVSFAIGLGLRDALTKSKLPNRPDEVLEDEAELMVDIEDTVDECRGSAEASEPPRGNVEQQVNPSDSESAASTDSFSSPHKTREMFDMSLSLDGACGTEPQPKVSSPAPPPMLSEAEAQSIPTDGFLSRLSRALSTNVGRLSLPLFSTSVPSALPTLSKRQREEGGSESLGEGLVEQNSGGPLKRVKTAEVRRTTSPARIKPEVAIKLEDRRASMPPLTGPIRTRRSGPPEFAPKAWHKKIELPNNVIHLT